MHVDVTNMKKKQNSTNTNFWKFKKHLFKLLNLLLWICALQPDISGFAQHCNQIYLVQIPDNFFLENYWLGDGQLKPKPE